MARIDGFVLNSDRDSFSIVVREITFFGKPTVAFNSGGETELVESGMGTIV
ncbi:unnamed protein product [Ectocarpus fasciculatus]